MNDISKAIYDIRKIDELGDSDTRIHKINSSIKIIVTIIYVIKILSIKQFTVINITCTILYPLIIFIIGTFLGYPIMNNLYNWKSTNKIYFKKSIICFAHYTGTFSN